MYVPIDELTIILRKIIEGKAFLMRRKHQFIYPNKENKFMDPNHEKKGDYYVNPCLSNLMDEL